MRTIIKATVYSLFVTGIFGFTTFAQTSGQHKADNLPAGIANLGGEDSSKILNDPVITLRLRRLMGRNYASFIESFETVTPITKGGKVLFASGCLIHACTHLESAIAIDLGKNTIHAAIYNDEKRTRFFNERGTRSPKPMIAWAKNLKDLKGNQR